MSIIFHQNMRNFGGGAPARNGAYNGAFAAASAALPGGVGPISIAGLTELQNYATTSAALGGPGGLCAALGVNLHAVVATRQTAVGQTVDYTGIGVAPGVVVLSTGRIIVEVWGTHAPQLHDDRAPAGVGFVPWCQNLPMQATADYQHVAYVILGVGGTQIGVAFLHNIYAINDARGLIVQQLPGAAALIRGNPAMAGAQAVYVGGDFNVGPINRGNLVAVSQGTLMPPAVGAPAQWRLLPIQVANCPPGQAGGTTLAGSLYDYSFYSLNGAPPPAGFLNPPVAWIDTRTLDYYQHAPVPMGSLMSDHVASMLRIQ